MDLGWWVETPLGSLGQLVSGTLLGAFAALVLRRPRVAATHPLALPLGAFTAMVCVGALRADDPMAGAVNAAHLLTPVLWLLAWWSVAERPPVLPVWVAAVAVPAGIGLVAWALGQPADHVLHGWPRLLGAYGNVHTHAGVMAMGAVTAGAMALRGPRWMALTALAAAVCLFLTYVRTAWLWAVVAAVATGIAHRGGTRATQIGALVLVGGGLTVALASGRLADVASVLTATAPDGGWSALGSSRPVIWGDALATFSAGPPVDWLVGRGLGDHRGLHRHFDPHSEPLSILFQLGAAGLLAWGWWLLAALGLAWRTARGTGRIEAALGFGLLLGACVTAPLSNDWLTRSTVALWSWGCLAWSLTRVPDPGPARGRQQPAA